MRKPTELNRSFQAPTGSSNSKNNYHHKIHRHDKACSPNAAQRPAKLRRNPP
jgi:hypothetical protein